MKSEKNVLSRHLQEDITIH